jgi:chromosome segregation ATPase
VSGAHVTSLESLERFRSSLVLFLERAHLVLDEVSEEVKRTRIWLQTEQRLKLGQEMKRRERELDMLEAELFSARLSDLAQKKTGVQMQVNQKRRDMREIEDTLRKLAGWLRNYDSTVETEAKKVEKLRHHLDTDMIRAVTFLNEAIRQLDAYSTGGDS